MRAAIALTILAFVRVSFADPAPPDDDDASARMDKLEKRLHDLERAQRINDATRGQVDELVPLQHFITAFIDVGAFAVSGNGAGIESDYGHVYYPKYANKNILGDWVFMGDPLATAINSLGEPADSANSREDSTDLLHTGGRPSILVNSIGLSIGRSIADGVSISSLIEFEPRPEHDVLDVELAHIDYRPTKQYDLIISAGKIDSVLGVEYRAQDAFNRLGITPSALCRYTCGRPLGIEARFTRGALSTSAALTDGDNFQQRFEDDPTLTPNKLPTASGHVQWMFPVGGQGLQLGTSGAYGPQDDQPSTKLHQWHYGFDARLRDAGGLDVTAEFIHGHQPGATTGEFACDLAPCLDYKAAYIVASPSIAKHVTPYVRADWRSATHIDGSTFIYESHDLRTTFGAHFEMPSPGRSRIIGKIEYTYVRELDHIPQFPDNVLTTSIVVQTD